LTRKLQPPRRRTITPPTRRHSLNAKYDRLIGNVPANAPFIKRSEADEETKKKKGEKDREMCRLLGLTEIESPITIEPGMDDLNGSRRYALHNLVSPTPKTVSIHVGRSCTYY